jgi:hypothetical protein
MSDANHRGIGRSSWGGTDNRPQQRVSRTLTWPDSHRPGRRSETILNVIWSKMPQYD